MNVKRRVRLFTWARRATALGFFGLLWVGTREEVTQIAGSLSATRFFGFVPFTDPLAALEVSLASRSWMGEMLLGASLLLALAALLGPVFCGWLCPLGFVLESWQSLRRFVLSPWPKLATKQLHLPREAKYGLLAAALVFSFVSRAPAFLAWSPIQGVARAVFFGAEGTLWLLAGLLLVESVAPRIWCRSLCPLGALYSIASRYAVLRVRIDPERAGEIRCQRCEVACPMGIKVMQDYTLRGRSSIDHPDCTRCGACTEVCPKSVLCLGLSDLPQDASNPADAALGSGRARTP
jgi:ferredoxin-type protein NapH